MPKRAIVRSPKDIGIIIAGIRQVHGLSQRDLAARLGVSQRYLSELELGKPKIADDRYFGLLRRLGVTLELVIGND